MKSTVKDELYAYKNVISFENVKIDDVNQNKLDINIDNDLKDFGKQYEENEDNSEDNQKPILSINNNNEFFRSKKIQKADSYMNFIKSSKFDEYNKSIDDNYNSQTLYKTN